MLKPVPAGHHHEKRGFFGWFNRGFASTTRGYTGLVGYVARRAGRFMVIYLALVAGLGWAYLRLPTAFLPNEDQGYLIVDMQAPPEASANRTIDVIKQVEDAFLSQPEAVERGLRHSGLQLLWRRAERRRWLSSPSRTGASAALRTQRQAIAARANAKLWQSGTR